MHLSIKLLSVVLFLFGTAGSLFADVVVLADGRRVEGKVIKRTATEVVVKTSFAELRFPMSEVVEIIEKKTKQEIYDEKLAAAKTADDFFELGEWCLANKKRRKGEQHFKKAVELDTNHEGARLALGFVKYKSEWMTPEERDARMAADFESEMKDKGLVQHDGQWVTPAEKQKLEAGLVLWEGRWIPKLDAMRLQGLEEFEGQWLPKERVRALETIAGITEAAGRPLNSHEGEQALLVGTLPEDWMARVDESLSRGRVWFDEAFGVKPGLELYGGRKAEFFVFDDDATYRDTVRHLAQRSIGIPEGWMEAVRRTYGFVWIDPVPISSSRLASRQLMHLEGHQYHHLGHMMLNRLRYEGRLLPAWFDEGVAALCEERLHGINAVYCRSSTTATAGSASLGGRVEFDPKLMRDGAWRRLLREALSQGRIEPFDKLAQREFSQLSLVDIATAITIVEWIESHGDAALGKFQRELRKGAPPAPLRVIRIGRERHAYYDKAFQAAVGMNHRRADGEWRKWFLSR